MSYNAGYNVSYHVSYHASNCQGFLKVKRMISDVLLLLMTE